jgi:ubiquinone/menaquinone biosynthesis C-methylase UbiE
MTPHIPRQKPKIYPVPESPPRYVPALSLDRLTPLYDALAALVGFGHRYAARVLAAAAPRDGEVLLDVGAGSGTLLVLAKRRSPRLRAIGLEPDPAILARARDKAGVAVELIRGGAAAIPLPDGSVDVAVSSLVFHHLPTEVKIAAIGEIRRVLAPRGRFLLADFGPPRSLPGRAFVRLVRALRLPEATTLQDNVAGRIPGYLATKFASVREAAPRYRGVRFLLAEGVAPDAAAVTAHRRAPIAGDTIV